MVPQDQPNKIFDLISRFASAPADLTGTNTARPSPPPVAAQSAGVQDELVSAPAHAAATTGLIVLSIVAAFGALFSGYFFYTSWLKNLRTGSGGGVGSWAGAGGLAETVNPAHGAGTGAGAGALTTRLDRIPVPAPTPGLAPGPAPGSALGAGPKHIAGRRLSPAMSVDDESRL